MSLTTIAKAWRLNRANVERPANLVQYQGWQSFTGNVVSNDQKRTAFLNNGLQQRQNVLNIADLLVSNQNVWIVQIRFHLVRVGYHVLRHVATVKAHPFNHVNRRVNATAVFNRDYAIVADLFHSIGNQFTNFRVSSRDGSNLRNVILALHFMTHLVQFFNGSLGSLVDTATNANRVSTGSNVLHPSVNDGLRQNGCRRRTVTGVVIGLGSNFRNEFGTHVLKVIFQFNVLGDRNPIVSNRRRAIALFQNNVATLRTDRRLNRIGQLIYPTQHCLACIFRKLNFFCHFRFSPH